MNLATKLLQRRHLKRLSQQDIADAVGVSQTTYHCWEKGSRLPAIQHIKALADILELPIEEITYLLGITTYSPNQTKSNFDSKNELPLPAESLPINKLLTELEDCYQNLQSTFEKYQQVHSRLLEILNTKEESQE